MKYLSLESDMTLGAIAFSIEKENEKEEDKDYTQFKDNHFIYDKQTEFIHLWLRFKDIHFLYDKQTEIHDLRWCELPADCEHKTLNELDQKIESENDCVEIAVEMYDQNESKWPFAPNYDEESIKVCLETGDIIDAFYKCNNQWYESVVKSVNADGSINVHYIGCNAGAVLTIDADSICPRATHTNLWKVYLWRGYLFVGYKIDIYDAAYHKWYSGQILETSDEKVKVHYDGYSSNYDEWIDTQSDRLKPLNTHTDPD
eukprot:259188_1